MAILGAQSVVRITRSPQDEEGFSDSSDDEKGGKGSKDGALWIGSEIAWSMLESTKVGKLIFRIVELTILTMVPHS